MTAKIQQNKDKPTTQKVKPSCIPVFNHKQQDPITQETQPKALQNNQQPSKTMPKKTLGNNQLKFIQTQHQLENHLYYLHHQHNTDKQLFQDHQHPIAADTHIFQDHQHPTMADIQPLQDLHWSTTTFISNHTIQDHSTINRYHYCHCHHTKLKHFQDHSYKHQDTTHSKYITYQFYYHTCHNTTLHRSKKTEDTGYIKTFHDKNSILQELYIYKLSIT